MESENNIDGGVRLNIAPQSANTGEGVFNRGHNGSGYGTYGVGRAQEPQGWFDADGGLDDASCSLEPPAEAYSGQTANGQQGSRPQYDRQCTRTVQLLSLPEGVTHADITGAIRGGLLLDIFLRANERSATVSFLRAVDARGFFDHVKKHDLYIKNKRVSQMSFWERRVYQYDGLLTVI